MSYILDALRKSEEKRAASGAQPAQPGFTFVKDSQPAKKNKFAFGLILTSFMLVSAMILGSGWWWSQKQQTDSELNSTAAPAVKAVAETATKAPPEPLPAASSPEPSTTASGSNSPPQSLMPSVQPADEIPYLEDMSAEFKQKIPTLNFSGHVYSDEPGLRMIMINDAVAREGAPVGTDLILYEITADGVVMRFQETRFQIKLF